MYEKESNYFLKEATLSCHLHVYKVIKNIKAEELLHLNHMLYSVGDIVIQIHCQARGRYINNFIYTLTYCIFFHFSLIEIIRLLIQHQLKVIETNVKLYII